MDEEEKWTQKIKNRDLSAFFPFAERMWKYSIANGIYSSDVKVLKKDYARSFHLAQCAGLAAVLYWNFAAMRTCGNCSIFLGLDVVNSVLKLGNFPFPLFAPH